MIFIYTLIRMRLYRMEDKIDKTQTKQEHLKATHEASRKELEDMITRRTEAQRTTLENHGVRIVKIETHIEHQTKTLDEIKGFLGDLNSKLDTIKEDSKKVSVNSD